MPGRFRLSEPHLEASAGGRDPEFGMSDAPSSGHEIQLTGPDQLLGPERVAV